MKKSISIKLEGCSKKLRKKAIRYLKSCGYVWHNGFRFNDGSWSIIHINSKELEFHYLDWNSNSNDIDLNKDWNKLCEYVEGYKVGDVVELVSLPEYKSWVNSQNHKIGDRFEITKLPSDNWVSEGFLWSVSDIGRKQTKGLRSKHFKKVEQEGFVVGEWYKLNGNIKCIANFTSKENGGYGIDYGGSWNNSHISMYDLRCWTKATPQEVQSMLEKEAVKRGYKEGVKIKSFFGSTSILHGCKSTELKNNELWMHSSIVFKDGQWAEIVEEKAPIVNGYAMEYDGEYAKFGCKKYHRHNIRTLLSTVKRLNIASILIEGGHTVTAEQLKEIVEYLNTKGK